MKKKYLLEVTVQADSEEEADHDIAAYAKCKNSLKAQINDSQLVFGDCTVRSKIISLIDGFVIKEHHRLSDTAVFIHKLKELIQ